MLKITTLIFPLLFALIINGQGVISNELQNVIADANSNDFISIRIEFKENVDCYYLNNEFKENEISVDERPKIVIQQLQNQANASQSELIENIQTLYKSSFRSLKQFWVVNIIIIEAKPELIDFLNTQSSISLLDYEDDKIIMHDAYKITSSNSQNPQQKEGCKSHFG